MNIHKPHRKELFWPNPLHGGRGGQKLPIFGLRNMCTAPVGSEKKLSSVRCRNYPLHGPYWWQWPFAANLRVIALETHTHGQTDGHYQVHYLPALLSYAVHNQHVFYIIVTKVTSYHYHNWLRILVVCDMWLDKSYKWNEIKSNMPFGASHRQMYGAESNSYARWAEKASELVKQWGAAT